MLNYCQCGRPPDLKSSKSAGISEVSNILLYMYKQQRHKKMTMFGNLQIYLLQMGVC